MEFLFQSAKLEKILAVGLRRPLQFVDGVREVGTRNWRPPRTLPLPSWRERNLWQTLTVFNVGAEISLGVLKSSSTREPLASEQAASQDARAHDAALHVSW